MRSSSSPRSLAQGQSLPRWRQPALQGLPTCSPSPPRHVSQRKHASPSHTCSERLCLKLAKDNLVPWKCNRPEPGASSRSSVWVQGFPQGVSMDLGDAQVGQGIASPDENAAGRLDHSTQRAQPQDHKETLPGMARGRARAEEQETHLSLPSSTPASTSSPSPRGGSGVSKVIQG